MNQIYKTDNGRKEIFQYYDKFIRTYPYVKELEVITKQGNTHILECGEENQQSLILLHGSA